MTTRPVPVPARVDALLRDTDHRPIPMAVPRLGTDAQHESTSALRLFLLWHWDLCGMCALPFGPGELRWVSAHPDDVATRQTQVLLVARGAQVPAGPTQEIPMHLGCVTYATLAHPEVWAPIGAETGRHTFVGWERAEVTLDVETGVPDVTLVNPRRLCFYRDSSELADLHAALLADEDDPSTVLGADPVLARRWATLRTASGPASRRELATLLKEAFAESSPAQIFGHDVPDAADEDWDAVFSDEVLEEGVEDTLGTLRAAIDADADGGPRDAAAEDVRLALEAYQLQTTGAFDGLSRSASCPCGSGRRARHCHGKYLPGLIAQ